MGATKAGVSEPKEELREGAGQRVRTKGLWLEGAAGYCQEAVTIPEKREGRK